MSDPDQHSPGERADFLAARDKLIASESWEAAAVPAKQLTDLTSVAPDEIARLEEQGMNVREIATRLYSYGAAIGYVAALAAAEQECSRAVTSRSIEERMGRFATEREQTLPDWWLEGWPGTREQWREFALALMEGGLRASFADSHERSSQDATARPGARGGSGPAT